MSNAAGMILDLVSEGRLGVAGVSKDRSLAERLFRDTLELANDRGLNVSNVDRSRPVFCIGDSVLRFINLGPDGRSIRGCRTDFVVERDAFLGISSARETAAIQAMNVAGEVIYERAPTSEDQ